METPRRKALEGMRHIATLLMESLIGKTYNFLTVVEKDEERSKDAKRPYWKCQCECGNFTSVRGDSLKDGRTKSCGCATSSFSLVGKKIGLLTLKEQVDRGGKNSKWLCECECGNTCIKLYSTIKKSPLANCGCRRDDFQYYKDLTGKRFGKLLVVEKVNRPEGRAKKAAYWRCICDCGGEKITDSGSLQSGFCKSCGCLVSFLEDYMKNRLVEKEIAFKTQFSFVELFFKNSHYPLRFDFAIIGENNQILCLIECQGKQHYLKEHTYYTEEGIIRDKMKQDYCSLHKIPLYRVYSAEEIDKLLDAKVMEWRNDGDKRWDECDGKEIFG